MAAREGKKVIYLFKTAKVAASVLAFQTEGSESVSNDVETTKTKSGPITTASGAEIEIGVTAVGSSESQELLDSLKEACKKNEEVECWKANLDQPGTGDNKFKGTYYKGRISEFTENEGAEDHLECEISYAVNGLGADGEVTVTAEQQEVASYVFKDTTEE